MANPTVERFMQTLQHTEQSGDVESLVNLFAEDAELSNLVLTEPLRGLAGARQFWSDYLGAFGQIRSHFERAIAADNAAVLEWVSEGKLHSGEPIRYRGVSILEIEGDRVRRFRSYYDSAAFSLK
ncbi:nuclear transport factor 2 family protein [Gloeobacter violaceus]|uniref:Glr2060 protein n=1 Tax=Gloeobacter violaceus (strain ATCC 29082 / PCC 7421) TaxID=251221 RepID=Q7NIX2_GLOVI|nr:nuclear transport factor 2 family protein [Gloeobacter violaceus]BAC90001.1 glr2060 [Gloeobacter violaceus PCC 7421]